MEIPPYPNDDEAREVQTAKAARLDELETELDRIRPVYETACSLRDELRAHDDATAESRALRQAELRQRWAWALALDDLAAVVDRARVLGAAPP